uniref:Uncharacterized protein n=1 Tax=Plectus sambesii TaxID=2011161 RepID=A0A914VXH7_9BILA
MEAGRIKFGRKRGAPMEEAMARIDGARESDAPPTARPNLPALFTRFWQTTQRRRLTTYIRQRLQTAMALHSTCLMDGESTIHLSAIFINQNALWLPASGVNDSDDKCKSIERVVELDAFADFHATLVPRNELIG